MDRLQAMRLFSRIVELGSFSRAAEQLRLQRASATQIIKQLEAHLGVRLLSRTTRQVTTTVDGAAYYQRCVAILADLDEAEAEFSAAARSPRGAIRIDLPGSLCRLVLMPALPSFCARYPDIRLEITIADRLIDLLREGVDCVLRIGDPLEAPLIACRLGDLQQTTCASASYLARFGLPGTLADISHHRAVHYVSAAANKAFPLEFAVDGRIETLSLPGNVAVNNGDAYVAACMAGFGIIQVSTYLVSEQLATGELVEVLPQHRPPALPLNALYPPSRQLPTRLRVFLDWLVEMFADQGEKNA